MKKRDTVIAVLALVLFFVLLGRVGYWESHYNRDGKVVEVNGEVITVEDNCGNLWDFYGDGYKVNDEVRMLMDSHHTDNIITDDTIERVELRA